MRKTFALPRVLSTLVFAAASLVAARASANGRIPAASQLVVAPDNPASMLLRTTFGFVFTADSGKTWDWLCESAVCARPTACQIQQDPAVALLTGGGVLSGQFEGLSVSLDDGCSWAFVSSLANTNVIDVARHPDGVTAIAATNILSSTNDAGVELYTSQIFQTTDAGKTWNALAGVIDPTLVLDTIDVAPSDPQRIYVTGQIYKSKTAEMLVSHDTGGTYDAYPIALAPGETGVYIAAVDPNNADLVYLRTLGTNDSGSEQTSRLLVSSDGGQTFVEHWSGDKMLGFALSADGARVYLGSTLGGLLAANASDLAFTQKSALQILCLMTSGSTLFMCANEANALAVAGAPFIVGSTTNEGASFTPLLALETIHAPLACPPNSLAAQCASQWPALEQQLSIDGGAAGAPDAGTPKTSGCGCESTPPHPLDAIWIGAPLALYLILRSRLFRGSR